MVNLKAQNPQLMKILAYYSSYRSKKDNHENKPMEVKENYLEKDKRLGSIGTLEVVVS